MRGGQNLASAAFTSAHVGRVADVKLPALEAPNVFFLELAPVFVAGRKVWISGGSSKWKREVLKIDRALDRAEFLPDLGR